jgi:hypothetical protein
MNEEYREEVASCGPQQKSDILRQNRSSIPSLRYNATCRKFCTQLSTGFGGHQEVQGNFEGRGFRCICTRNIKTITLGNPWFCEAMKKKIRLLHTTLESQCPSMSL